MRKLFVFPFFIFISHILFAQWQVQSSGTNIDLRKVFFTDANNGWIAGGFGWCASYESGIILHTQDGGNSWEVQMSSENLSVNGIFFTDPNNGWVVGDCFENPGFILHTSDGGNTWENQYTGVNNRLMDIYFIDANIGWAVGSKILHTTDGGDNWVEQNIETNYTYSIKPYIKSVSFSDSNNGWAVGSWDGQGTTWHTSNGGFPWQMYTPSEYAFNNGVFFKDSNTGWIVGKYEVYLDPDHYLFDVGRIVRIGDTWELQYEGAPGTNYNSTYFVDLNNGWVVGDDGAILYTINGGGTWEELDSGTTYNLNSVYFIDQNNGWAVGDNGVVLRTENGGGIVGSVPFPVRYASVIVNTYPNPFSNTTSIAFKLLKCEEVVLSVFNQMGQLVEELINSAFQQGEHQIEWTPKGIPTGIYFLRMKAGEETLTKKMILLRSE